MRLEHVRDELTVYLVIAPVRHRSELQHDESQLTSSEPLLAEQDWASARNCNGDRDDDEHRTEDQHEGDSEDEIESPLRDVGPQRDLAVWATPDPFDSEVTAHP
jgi:hypothetical protein